MSDKVLNKAIIHTRSPTGSQTSNLQLPMTEHRINIAFSFETLNWCEFYKSCKHKKKFNAVCLCSKHTRA
jgi:hypothetical protein